jgi:hypothetical protein
MIRKLGLALTLVASAAGAAAVVKSGPQAGERTLPFTSNMVSGPQRGKQYCYICELKDEPAVLVFARKTDAATARLMQQLREQVREHAKERLFVWFVFLGEPDTASQTALERQAYEFARANGTASMPVSALGDPQGPPGYLISPTAQTTVLMFRNRKVIANQAFTPKDWSNKAADNCVKALPQLLAGVTPVAGKNGQPGGAGGPTSTDADKR